MKVGEYEGERKIHNERTETEEMKLTATRELNHKTVSRWAKGHSQSRDRVDPNGPYWSIEVAAKGFRVNLVTIAAASKISS